MKLYIPQYAVEGLTQDQADDVRLMVERGLYSASEAREVVLRPKRKVRVPTMQELIEGARRDL